MPQDIKPIRTIDLDRLNHGTLGQDAIEVTQFVVHSDGHDGAVFTEEIKSSGSRVRHPLLAHAACCDGDGHGGHN
jgi:hypothetical protein